MRVAAVATQVVATLQAAVAAIQVVVAATQAVVHRAALQQPVLDQAVLRRVQRVATVKRPQLVLVPVERRRALTRKQNLDFYVEVK